MEYERFEFQQPTWGGVNVLWAGDTLVDTGHVAPVSRDAVREAVESGPLAGVERVVHTHPHIDHVGGSQTLDVLADLTHVVPESSLEILRGYTDSPTGTRGDDPAPRRLRRRGEPVGHLLPTPRLRRGAYRRDSRARGRRDARTRRGVADRRLDTWAR